MRQHSHRSRREFLASSAVGLAAGVLLNFDVYPATPKSNSKQQEKEVTATEDLMREHGILRRALLVYTAVVPKIRSSAGSVSPQALQRTAKLFRAFGEEYHEKMLEEKYIFPVTRRNNEALGKLADVLITQHNRGREITDYVLGVTQGNKMKNHAEALAGALESFVLMYRHHAAREDTILFPAWKKVLTAKELDEMAEKFEEMEHHQFGEDGFEQAARQMSEIEQSLEIGDITQFTASLPPKIAKMSK